MSRRHDRSRELLLSRVDRGIVVSGLIGQADADDAEALLGERPNDVFDAIPDGPSDVDDPEFESLTADHIPDGLWFDFSMGIKKSLNYDRQTHWAMPERSILAWLGFLRGELEGGASSQAGFDKLRALLPPVWDDLTPFVAATQ